MPRGRKKKEVAANVNAETLSEATTEILDSGVPKTETETPEEVTKSESVAKGKTREDFIKEAGPLGEGQAYFEAPDGTVIVGEGAKTRLFYRAGGLWIRRMR